MKNLFHDKIEKKTDRFRVAIGIGACTVALSLTGCSNLKESNSTERHVIIQDDNKSKETFYGVQDILSVQEMKEATSITNTSYEELKEYIDAVSDVYDIPKEIIPTIIDVNSNGKWNTNGFDDEYYYCGLAQLYCGSPNGEYFSSNLGFGRSDILYNPYKAIEATAFLAKDFMKCYHYTKDNIDYHTFFTAYITSPAFESKLADDPNVRKLSDLYIQTLEKKYSHKAENNFQKKYK